MKTLFINPPNAPITSNSISIEPIDVLAIATYARSLGNEVAVMDMDRGDGRKQELIDLLEKEDFGAVVIIHDYHIPLFQDGSQQLLSDIISICKSYGTKVVVGGKLSTYAPKKLLMNGNHPDVVIHKEMEIPLEKLLENEDWSEEFLKNIQDIAFRKGDEVIETGKVDARFDINKLPIPDRRLVNVDEYIDVRTMLTSRGCSFGCSFCSVPDFWGKRRSRTAEDIVEEILYLEKELGAKKVLFLDDNATIEKERMIRISKLLIAAKSKVRLGCLGNLRSFDEEMMKLMYKAGFRWIHYGIESGSEKLLKSVNKYIPKNQVKEVIKKTKKIGFRVRTSWIMDLPCTDSESIKETADLMLELQPHEIRLHFLTIRFGSKIFKDHMDKSDELPKQYIHGNKGESSVNSSILKIISQLEESGYKIINDIEENSIFEGECSDETKIASFSPLRYGIGWN